MCGSCRFTSCQAAAGTYAMRQQARRPDRASSEDSRQGKLRKFVDKVFTGLFQGHVSEKKHDQLVRDAVLKRSLMPEMKSYAV